MSKEERFYVVFDGHERNIMIHSLNDEKNIQRERGKTTDGIDDLILKIAYAPQKRYKVVDRSEAR